MKKSLFVFCALNLFWACSYADALEDESNLLEKTPLELSSIKVTSVSKRSESLSNSAAAIYVINNEDIKRAGVTSIPEALRLAPGMNVTRIDSNQWAVSARGFNGRFANKLMVLMDGRSLYNPFFAGVYWENQDVMLEDVERIEVIRGPGAALWGSNAVNGVINIITKNTKDTKGGLLTLGGGSQERNFGAGRYGFELDENTTGRVYIKGFDRNEMKSASGRQGAGDDWNEVQGGFKLDSKLSQHDTVTLQGDLFRSGINQQVTFKDITAPGYQLPLQEPVNSSGGNITGRWQHHVSEASNYSLQFYFDNYQRHEPLVNAVRNNADIDFQHHYIANDWNEVVWGLNYRISEGKTSSAYPQVFRYQPANQTNEYYGGFLQDQLTLINQQLWLTLGVKLEHNDFSGFEVQPTARLMWEPHHQHRLWGAVSRGVRIPSLLDNNVVLAANVLPPQTGINQQPLPLLASVTGWRRFEAEQLLAYEAGYRFLLSNDFTFDATAFYNDYSSLRDLQPAAPQLVNSANPYIYQPLYVTNANSGYTYGVETSTRWQMLDWWRWDLNYSYFHANLTGSAYYQESVSPQNQISLRAMIEPVKDITFDTWLRFVDKSQAYTLTGMANIEAYAALDLRLAWKALPTLELSVTGQNLVDSQHLEYVKESYTSPTAISRGVYGKVMWSF